MKLSTAIALAAITIAGSPSGNSVLGPPQFDIAIPERPRADEPARGALLTGDAGAELVKFQCTEGKTKGLRWWTPDEATIGRLETDLVEFMSRQKTPPDYKPLHEYYRQYVGFTRRGRKLACVNLFHAHLVESTLDSARRDPTLFDRLSVGGRPEDYWKRQPVMVMDGGANYFTVIYDPETSEFYDLRFNGYA